MPDLPQFRPGASAGQADRSLRESLRVLDRAQHCAVLWYGEIMRRGLHRDLGYATMRAYAMEELGFSSTRAGDFNRLAAKIEELPVLKEQLATGRLGYSKAREIIPVATRETEQAWVAFAAQKTRAEVRVVVRQARRQEVAERRANPAQTALMPAPAANGPRASLPVTVGFELTAGQYARYEALLASIGPAGSRAELLLAMAEALLAQQTVGPVDNSVAGEPNQASPSTLAIARRRATPSPPVQIHVHACPECAARSVATPRGEMTLAAKEAAAAACDAEVDVPGRPLTATIPPRVRREVLARDRHHCRRRGCGHTRHLHLHHIRPRAAGGGHEAANLVTLCAACHHLWHERGGEMRGLLREVGELVDDE